MKTPKILFLVSPNFGLLDSWLPVLWELKKKRPDVNITAVFPKAETVSEIDPNETTARLGETIFSEVVFRSRAGFWVSSDSLRGAYERSQKSRVTNLIIGKMRTALHVFDSILLMRFIAAFFDDGIAFFARALTDEKHVSLEALGADVRAICFDLYAKTKRECRDILDRFPETPRFSILHGLAVADYELQGGDYDRGRSAYRTTAYLYSSHEVATCERNYGLKRSEIKVVGVPRHDPHWIHILLAQAQAQRDVPASWDRYLFVISRPALGNFFPREQKREALEDIKKLAFEELRAKIVVKLHPTERVEKNNDGLCEEVFGKESYGKEWMYSSSHPFVLGKDSLFAISFYSGVCIDMLALGVPTIQRVDLKPQPGTGTIMDFEKRGLVLRADGYEELKNHAVRIMNDKNAVLRDLQPNYREFFAPIGNPVNTITNDICEVL